MSKLYFEEKGEEILRNKGVRKAEFARRMGIRKQNVNTLFKTKNLDTIFRASKVLDVPLELLISYTEEPDLV
jgi:plasmid maintenance system antidote protein VapI